MPTEPGPESVAAEAAALRQVVRELDSPGCSAAPSTGSGTGPAAQLAATPYDGLPARPPPRGRPGGTAAGAAAVLGPAAARPACRGQGRVAITVAGLGSSSTEAAVDDLRSAELGYEPGRVLRFSYAGGRTPPPGRRLPGAGGPRLRLDRHPGRRRRRGRAAGGRGRGRARLGTGRHRRPVRPLARWPRHAAGAARPGRTRRRPAAAGCRRHARDASPRGGPGDRRGRGEHPGRRQPGADVAERASDVGIDPDAVVVRQLAEGSDVVKRLATAGGAARGQARVDRGAGRPGGGGADQRGGGR